MQRARAKGLGAAQSASDLAPGKRFPGNVVASTASEFPNLVR